VVRGARAGRARARAGAKVALSDSSLALRAGSVFGLLGENGAGKTTTLALLQGLYPPSGGRAVVAGFDAQSEQPLVRLALGVCPQHDVLWPMLTAAEHLLFYARVKGVAAAHERAAVDAMLRRVGLAEFANRASSALSGGMRRRLSVGIAMIGAHTHVVLLDELTTGLDPASRRAVWRIVERARRAQPDALFIVVSHDMAEVEALCSGDGSRCAIMTHGRVRCVGSVARLRERYGGGCVLRVSFRLERALASAREAALLPVGAIVEEEEAGGGEAGGAAGGGGGTEGWARAAAHVRALFPPGAGSARVDSAAFQTRSVDGARVVESGSAAFVLRVGRAGSQASELSVAGAFRAMMRSDKALIVGWALEAQTLDKVFARVVRHYKKE
jgi:ABC-type multidrug transport system ATPase subunit